MFAFTVLILLILLISCLISSSSAACSQSYSASYDLSQSPLLTSASPVFHDGDGKYHIQPCGAVPVELCPNSEGHQTCYSKMSWELVSDSLGTSGLSVWSPLDGDWNKGAVSVNADVPVNYDQCQADPVTNQVQIVYSCESGVGDDVLKVVKEPTPDKTGACIFHFKVDSTIVCAGGKSSSKSSGGLSSGWIFVIVLVVFMSVYSFGGMAFNRFMRQKAGCDMYPNIEFWRDLPGLVKDGCVFTVKKVRGVCGVKSADSGSTTGPYDTIL